MFLFTSYINIILFFFIFYEVVDSRSRLMKILFIACLGTGLYSLSAMIQGGLISQRLVFGETFDPNDLAFFTLSFLPLNISFLSKENGLLKRLVCAGNLITGTLLILSTGSRGGFVGLCVVILMLFLAKTVTFTARYKAVFVGIILIGLSLFAINFSTNEAAPNLKGDSSIKGNEETETTLWSRYESILSLKDDYNVSDEQGRLAIWETGLKFMVEAPLTGVGISCFDAAIGADRKERGLQERWQTAHNSLIQMGAETGVIGFVLFAVMSFNAFRIFRQVKRKGRSRDLVKVGEMALIGFSGLFITAMFLSQAYSIYWALYVVLSAVVYNLDYRSLLG